jgi:hypothetical protein
MYKCIKCSKEFNYNYLLQRHNMKKNKCMIDDDQIINEINDKIKNIENRVIELDEKIMDLDNKIILEKEKEKIFII